VSGASLACAARARVRMDRTVLLVGDIARRVPPDRSGRLRPNKGGAPEPKHAKEHNLIIKLLH
jgi:hypothetical protein